jgi:predicted enzyme related to lactoylglutathione lyase
MPHRSRLAGFIIDCQTGDIDAAATFWAGALGLAIGDKQIEGAAEYVEFQSGASGLHIEVQKVQHPSRVHLDIETDDLEAEAARLEALGAKKVAFVKRWWVMEAPTGQRFCIVRMKHPEQGETPNEWP